MILQGFSRDTNFFMWPRSHYVTLLGVPFWHPRHSVMQWQCGDGRMPVREIGVRGA